MMQSMKIWVDVDFPKDLNKQHKEEKVILYRITNSTTEFVILWN